MFCLHESLCTTCVACVCKGQKRVLNPLKLEIEMIVNYEMWVLGTEPGLL